MLSEHGISLRQDLGDSQTDAVRRLKRNTINTLRKFLGPEGNPDENRMLMAYMTFTARTGQPPQKVEYLKDELPNLDREVRKWLTRHPNAPAT